MNSIENKVFDLQNIKKNPEKEIDNIENKQIPEQKYIKICEQIWNDNEFMNEVCKSLDINLIAWLDEKGIDFKKIYESKWLKLEVA